MIEHRACSLCNGRSMVMTTDGMMVCCPACRVPQVAPVVVRLDPAKVDTYIDQCSISANLATIEPLVEIKPVAETRVGMSDEMRKSRSEKMKRSWIERKAKAAEVKAE